MSQTHRSRSTARSPPVSRPFQQERPVPVPTVSPSSMSNKSVKHRPSLSGTMGWLGRSSSSASSSSAPYTPSKPIRISEPKMQSAFDVMTQRSGTLGSGATVVRTPQEALGVPSKPLSFEPEGESLGFRIAEEDEDDFNESPKSPPLPPIPVDEEEREDVVSVKSRSSRTPRPNRAPPPAPLADCPSPDKRSQRPALKVLDHFPPVPALPSNVALSPPQPPFDPILISNGASGAFDRSKVMVILETTTQTYKTTFNTLTSRPSYLASYLESLLPSKRRDADEVSVNSQASEAESTFNSIFHNHLASSGLVSASATSIHIFLDRPSAPYAHILAYLRTPEPTPEYPAALPRAVHLSTSSSSSRLEALLELRDEAKYLDLEELHKLCMDEIRHRQNASTRATSHSRGMSSVSVSSSSIRSLHTLQENVNEYEEADERRHSRDSGVGSSVGCSTGSISSLAPRSSVVPEVGWHSTPAPIVPGLSQRVKYSSMKAKPTGAWI